MIYISPFQAQNLERERQKYERDQKYVERLECSHLRTILVLQRNLVPLLNQSQQNLLVSAERTTE